MNDPVSKQSSVTEIQTRLGTDTDPVETLEWLEALEAVIEHVGQGVLVHVLADEDEFLPTVAVTLFPDAINVALILGPFGAGDRSPEVTGALVAADRSRLGPKTGMLEPSAKPKETFGSNDPRPFFLKAIVETLWVKRNPALVDEV